MKVFRNNFAIEKNVLILNLLQLKCYLFFAIQTCILISNKKITPRHSLINEFKTNCARDCGLFTMTYFVGCVLDTFLNETAQMIKNNSLILQKWSKSTKKVSRFAWLQSLGVGVESSHKKMQEQDDSSISCRKYVMCDIYSSNSIQTYYSEL